MLEIRITAPELAEAMNNLARAIGLATTTQTGETSGATPTSTTSVVAEEVPAAPAEVTSTPPQTVLPTEAAQVSVQNPTIPVSAPQTAPVAQSVPNVSTPAPEVTPAPIVPTAAPQYTLDMLANAGATLINAGKMSSVMAILAKFGVEALTSLPPDKYGAVALELRSLGAQI